MTIRLECGNTDKPELFAAIGRIATTLAMCLALSACGGANEKQADTVAAIQPTATEIRLTPAQVEHGGVRWESVSSTSMTSRAEIPGHLAPDEDRTARLGAPAQGRLVAVHVRFGDQVSRGQPLVTLQSPQAGTARADYAKAVAALRSSRAAAAYSRAAADRAENLLVAKAMARQEVERARADNELAQSSLSQAEAEVARARAEMTQLGVSANGTMVMRSPLSGIVLSRDAVPGAVVDAGAPLVTVSDP
ncbi:MAG: efflux RND transporter periplasmic adaptor subunit, partial [Gemmatimonadales bacterium]